MKTCSRCHTDRDSGEFYKRRASADGLDSWCKPCRREAALHRYTQQCEAAPAHRTAETNQAARALIGWLLDAGATRDWIAEQAGCSTRTISALREGRGGRCRPETVAALRRVVAAVGRGLLIPPRYAKACERREKRKRKRAERRSEVAA